MKLKAALACVGATAAVVGGMATAAPAQAIPPGPGQCVSGFSGFGGYEDCDLWPDGSFHHRWWGGFIGYGGGSGRVCDGMPPPPTDMDPRTPCPGVG